MKNSVKFDHFTKSDFSPFDNILIKPLLAKVADESPYNGYLPISPVKSDLRKSTGGEQLRIQGKIFDKSGSWPVGNAGIEVWHLSSGTEGFKHRAKLSTDPSGAFQLITDLPARQKGHNFKIFFKITVGVNAYYTQLSFNHSMAWLSNRSRNLKNIDSFYNNLGRESVGLNNYFEVEIRLDH